VTQPLLVGSASRDVTSEDPRGWRLGGAATYAGLALARLGMRPRVVLGVDPEAAVAEELEMLRDAGAELHLVRLEAGPVFENRNASGSRVQRCLEPGRPVPAVVPAGWTDSSTWLFVPVADELPEAWALLPPPDAFVALGWQGLLRDLPRGGIVTRRPPARHPLLSRAGLVCVSREDVDPAMPIEDLATLLRPPATLVVTGSSEGGTIWELAPGEVPRVRLYEAIPSPKVVDPTGTGDTFLAGLVAERLGHPLGGSDARSLSGRLAAAVASLTVEGPGLSGVPDQASVMERLDAWRGAPHGGGVEAAGGAPQPGEAPAPEGAPAPDDAG
jgi:sugar/nucleoside kinase (ribokinase family)